MPELNSGERCPEGRGFRGLWRGDNGVETAVLHGGQNFRQELPDRERAVHAKDDYPVFHVCLAGRSFLFAADDFQATLGLALRVDEGILAAAHVIRSEE